MKKITIFIVCIFISSILFAEDILPEESFETSVPPAGWYDYSSPSWEKWMQNGSQHHTGSYSAAHGPTMDYTISWLVTPLIDLTGYSNMVLSYWEYVVVYGGADIQSVKISTDYTGSGDPSLATWTTLNSTIGTADTWSQVQLDLSSYSGSTVYIGFQYGGADATMWFIDDVKITGDYTLPVELAAFTATYDYFSDCALLNWTTASEVDVIGFNVYKNTIDEFETSSKLSNNIIEGHGTTTMMNEYSFADESELIFGSTYYYWLESIELGGTNEVSNSISFSPEDGTGGYEDSFDIENDAVLNNFPNPCSGSTTIEYAIQDMLRSQVVAIQVYNILGQLIDTIEGQYGSAVLNTKQYSPGIYFYQLQTDNYKCIKKLIVAK